METVLILGLLVCFGGMALAAWGLRCNNITYRDQSHLANKIFAKFPDGKFILPFDDIDWFRTHLLDRVSYEAHHWRLMTFRDPWVLYGRENLKKLDEKYDAAVASRVISSLIK